ncbi:MAG: adaptor protein MecA [Lachnospiraceae bacterium]|nr:adaptor protein MecA [Lachnospiraceae bacterium]
MTIKRINDNTISCTISPEDLRTNGIELDDLFDRKKEAVDFIRQTVAQVAISENFDLRGDLTTMRISVLPDRSLNLLITREDTKEGAAREVRRIARSIFDSIASRAAENAGGQDNEQEGSASESLMKSLLAGISESSEEKSEDGQEKKQLPMAGDTFMFSFFSVRDAMDCCRVFADAGPVESSLYYLREDDIYFLIVHRTEDTPAGFEKCVLSANEFGELVTSEEQYIAFVTEHGDCVAKDHAIEMFMNVIPGIGENVIDGKKTRKRHKKDAVSAENTLSSVKKKDDPEEA